MSNMDNLIEIGELMDFLGYKGETSAINWCIRNHIPVQTFGKKRYADRFAFNSLVAKSLGVENQADYTKGHRATDDVTNPGPGSDGKPRSEAAQKFLTKFKSEEHEKGANNI